MLFKKGKCIHEINFFTLYIAAEKVGPEVRKHELKIKLFNYLAVLCSLIYAKL